MRSSADRQTSFGCFLSTSTMGAFSTLSSATSFWNTGVSRMPSRIHIPIPTSTMLSANGTRQPQVRNWSPDMAAAPSMTTVDRNNPAGTPHCGHDARKPRLCWPLRDHSIDSSTEPPHSPPTPMP
jgi:hypothetical protein